MKLVRNGENSVRISLTAEDLSSFSICLEDFDHDSSKGRKVIGELFDRAREETGFEIQKEKVYIQLYPKKDGGCELFVIKLEEEKEMRECFSFHSFDALHFARSLLPPTPEGCNFYRLKNREEYLVLIPSAAVPQNFAEFGERLKKTPSRIFFNTHCKQILTKKDEKHDPRREGIKTVRNQA